MQCESPFLPPETQWATVLSVVCVNCLNKKLLARSYFQYERRNRNSHFASMAPFSEHKSKGAKGKRTCHQETITHDNQTTAADVYSVRTSALGYYISRCEIYLCLNFLYGKLFWGNDLLLLPDKGNLDSSFPTLIFWELKIETAVCRRAFVQFAHHGLCKGHSMKGLRSHDWGVLGAIIIIRAFFIESLI